MPLGELGSDSTLPQETKPGKPKKPPATAATSTTGSTADLLEAAVSPVPDVVPAPVVNDLGMLTGALTTFEDLFGSNDDGLVAPNQQQAEVINSLSIGDDEKERLLSGITPEQVQAIAEQAPYVDQPGGYRHRGNGSGWDAPAAALQSEAPLSPAMQELEQADSRRAVRADALGVDLSGAALSDKTPQAKEMSWEEYEALSDRQRGAVDFNTMLTAAVQRDLRKGAKLQGKASEDMTKAYDQQVADMFGEDGGSDIFAPETVALLDQISFTDPNADLDDFLGLKTVIRGRDLKNLDSVQSFDTVVGDISVPPAGISNPERAVLQATLADATVQAEMDRVLAAGAPLLDDMVSSMALERQDQVNLLGGRPKDVNMPLGYGSGRVLVDLPSGEQADVENDFRLVFEALADAGNQDKINDVLGIAKTKFDSVDPKLFSKFSQYLDSRSRQSETLGLPMGENGELKYLTPEQFRAKLGLTDKEPANAER